MSCFNFMKSKEAISSRVKKLTLNMKVGKCHLNNAGHRWNGLGHTEMLVFSSTASLYFKCGEKNLFKKWGSENHTDGLIFRILP